MDIRWGIIGCGDVTEVKSGPGLQLVEGSRLVAVMRRRADLAKDYARRHGVPSWSGDAEAVIGSPDVDAVYVATPPGSHLEYALRVCAAGKPCYVEKPMARSHAECERMVAAFADARLPLFVAYYRRALPRFLKARELIQGGRLGAVTGVHYRFTGPAPTDFDRGTLPWRFRAEEAGGGLFMDLGCHTLDILDLLLGPLQEVAGTAANVAGLYDVEDTVAMVFSTASGAPGAAHWNFVGGIRDDLIQITGREGRLSFSTFGSEPVRLETASGVETSDLPNPRHVQLPLIRTIVADLQGRGECPSTGTSAARTARVMDQVLAGYYAGRDDRFWTRRDSWPGRQRTLARSD